MEDPTPSEIYRMLKNRGAYENFYFLEHEMRPPFILPELTEEQKEIHRKASEIVNKYVPEYKIVFEKHNPVVLDSLIKELGLDNKTENL